MERCDLVLMSNKKLAYSYPPSGWSQWLPFQRYIVRLWNCVACRVFEHSWYPGDIDPDYKDSEWFCCDCCKVEYHPEWNVG